MGVWGGEMQPREAEGEMRRHKYGEDRCKGRQRAYGYRTRISRE